MWTRKELKGKAKSALSRNYWKAVLVGLISIVLGAISTLLSGDDDGLRSGIFNIFGRHGIGRLIRGMTMQEIFMFVLGISAVVMIISVLFTVFIENPLRVGTEKFYIRSLAETGQLKDVGCAFKNNYWNSVKIMFLRSLYIFLWSLLCIIPAMFEALTSLSFLSIMMLIGCFVLVIIKAYEYMMIPYILGDNPNISSSDAFTLSKRLMDGEKWNTFMLQLSFTGWWLLSAITFGIVYIFYAAPYYNYTIAALYRKLSGADEVIESSES